MNRQRKKPVKVDSDKIAKGLGTNRRGRVRTTGGFFGALQTAANRPGPLPTDEEVSERVTEIMRHIFGPSWRPR